MSLIESLGEVWGCNLLHKAPIDGKHKVKTACNRTIVSFGQASDEDTRWARDNGHLCKRCFVL